MTGVCATLCWGFWGVKEEGLVSQDFLLIVVFHLSRKVTAGLDNYAGKCKFTIQHENLSNVDHLFESDCASLGHVLALRLDEGLVDEGVQDWKHVNNNRLNILRRSTCHSRLLMIPLWTCDLWEVLLCMWLWVLKMLPNDGSESQRLAKVEPDSRRFGSPWWRLVLSTVHLKNHNKHRKPGNFARKDILFTVHF